MLRCSRFVNISIHALQTWSNVNSIMLNVRAKREQLFFAYSLKSSKKKVAKLHVFEALKNGHVGDVAQLAFREYFYSSSTNLLECQQHDVEWAGEERTAFRFVFMKIE